MMCSWFGVRCLFRVLEGSFEERVTIWRARSHEEAISMPEAEALEYADVLEGVEYLDLAQSYLIGDRPEHGSEVFSLVRDSDLSDDDYLDTFFNTGGERQRPVDETSKGEA